ncbi:hypothetical protein KQI68_06585 [Peptoniphilus sp. MSJ-1]|uniref:Uncharacterized protein n=1 Tax=Peptoniphilus ovalis TaxID=2841503 RepID=A0ABS6FH59_9FIRM|nr:hypothetical protein [Peptoniphilus ovalis]MBU5669504.1 hypothetical protein [Peptoniphilus ovalis]
MNGNSNGLTHLKRMELEFKGHSYLFTINPEQYELKIPNRANATYTKAGVYLDLFGEGLRELTVSGITGFKSTTEDPEHGYKKFLLLKSIIRENMQDIEDGKPVKDFLMFYNHTDGEGYETIPTRLSILRNVSQPLLYKYDMSFYVIRDANQPRGQNEGQGIGNSIGTPKTAPRTVEDRVLKEKDGANNNFSPQNLKDLAAELLEF